MISNEVLLAIVGILTVLAKAWADRKRKEQDRKTQEFQQEQERKAQEFRQEQERKALAMQREVEKAREEAAETQALLGIVQRMMTRQEAQDAAASEERKVWTKVVEQNADAKIRLVESVNANTAAVGANTEAVVGVTQEVTKNTGAVTTHGAKVDEMQSQFVAFQSAVGEQFAAFKQQLDAGLSEERLGPILDLVFERFMKRIQGVIVHAPQIGEADPDDTLNLQLDSQVNITVPPKDSEPETDDDA